MTVVAAVLFGMVTVGGVVVVIAWAAGVLGGGGPTAGRGLSTVLWIRAVDGLGRVSRRTWLLGGASLVSAVALALWTGSPLLLVIVPLGVVGLPRLLSAPDNHEIEVLGALDRWVRALIAALSTGRSITDAIRLSATQAPAGLGEPLVALVARLDDRWTPAQALARFADDLDSADADAVLASLMLAVQRGGAGAVVTLSALADSIQDRLKALREIEAERAKPRAVVRQVTVITLVVLAASFLFGREFFAPYGTPLGQTILAVLLIAYVGSLWMLRRMTIPRKRARILRAGS